jgi:transcriptional regulator with XRE-family HTH domain
VDEDAATVLALGREFRTLRSAAGRTVASVAADAGLSVPYIANLENGRGNPTVSALSRLAAALGRRLTVGIARPGEEEPPSAGIPASLGRFARTRRFRETADVLAQTAGVDTARLLSGLSSLAGTLELDLGEADWSRLLDAILLVTAHQLG